MIPTPRVSGISPGLETRIERAPGETECQRRHQERLSDENARLTLEVARLAQENEDLRESAKIWIWLYESHLDRANRAVAELQTLPSNRRDPAA